MESFLYLNIFVDASLQIVETMSFTPNVEEFLETLGPFYEYVKDENSCLDINANGTDKKGSWLIKRH